MTTVKKPVAKKKTQPLPKYDYKELPVGRIIELAKYFRGELDKIHKLIPGLAGELGGIQAPSKVAKQPQVVVRPEDQTPESLIIPVEGLGNFMLRGIEPPRGIDRIPLAEVADESAALYEELENMQIGLLQGPIET